MARPVPREVPPRGTGLAPPLAMPSGHAQRPLVLIGDPSTVFVQHPAMAWRRQGHEVVIVTSRLDVPPEVAGVRVVSADRQLSVASRRELGLLASVLDGLEAELRLLPDPVRDEAAACWHGKPMPAIGPVVWDAFAIREAVASLQPRAVFGQEAFAYGLATALSQGAPRSLMVWGGDVMFFADASPVTRALMRFVLRAVDTVLVCGTALRRRVVSYFGVPEARCQTMSLGVDRGVFHPLTPEGKAGARAALGIPADAAVVMNLRRCDPLWGGERVLDTCGEVAAARPGTWFLLVGGAGNDSQVQALERRLADRGAAGHVRALPGQVPIEEYARCLQVADVGLSLPTWEEPASWSVLQAMAAGVSVVSAGLEAYRELAGLGARLALVDPREPRSVAREVLGLLASPEHRTAIWASNDEYLGRHQDVTREMGRLLAIVEHGQRAA